MHQRLWSFQTGGTKLEKNLPKNPYPQRKLFNFENWVNGEESKIGHHFRKQSDLNSDVIEKCAPKSIFFIKKRLGNIRIIFDFEN